MGSESRSLGKLQVPLQRTNTLYFHPLWTAQCHIVKKDHGKDGPGGWHSLESGPQRSPLWSLQFGGPGTSAYRAAEHGQRRWALLFSTVWLQTTTDIWPLLRHLAMIHVLPPLEQVWSHWVQAGELWVDVKWVLRKRSRDPEVATAWKPHSSSTPPSSMNYDLSEE